MAIRVPGTGFTDNRISICGHKGFPFKQDLNDRMEAVFLGSEDKVVAQDEATGELLSSLTGDAGEAFAQDDNNRLEAALFGSQDNVFSQDASDRLEAALYGDSGLLSQDANNRLEAALYGDGGLIAQDASNRLESVLIGNEGIAIDQEADTGKGLMRLGGDAAQADIDVGTAASPHDLQSGDYESGDKDAGGAQYLAGKLKSAQDANFTVTVDWLDDDGNTTISSSPSALTDTSDVEFNLLMRSDKFKVSITDTSGGANDLQGTINAH